MDRLEGRGLVNVFVFCVARRRWRGRVSCVVSRQLAVKTRRPDHDRMRTSFAVLLSRISRLLLAAGGLRDRTPPPPPRY